MPPANLEREPIEEAVAELRRGALVVMPTETVYGLAADARNPEAVAKIFELKGRPRDRPLIVHVAGAEALGAWARDVPESARRLAAAFWPGPLTLVLERAPGVPEIVTAGQPTVAIRVPAHPVALELLEAFGGGEGGGVAAPSANPYGRVSPTTAEHVRRQLGERAPRVLDGGPCEVGIESTIVCCTGERPVILRPGMVSAEALSEAAGVAVEAGGRGESGRRGEGGEPVRVPGQDGSHYAPAAPCRLVSREAMAAWARARGGRGGYLGFGPAPFEAARAIRLPRQPQAAARDLYRALHELDALGLDWILLEPPPAGEAWAGLGDRLRRAAGVG